MTGKSIILATLLIGMVSAVVMSGAFFSGTSDTRTNIPETASDNLAQLKKLTTKIEDIENNIVVLQDAVSSLQAKVQNQARGQLSGYDPDQVSDNYAENAQDDPVSLNGYYISLQDQVNNDIASGIFSWTEFVDSAEFQKLDPELKTKLLGSIAARVNSGELDVDSIFK